MYSYYTNDKKSGIEDDEILELLEEFFISLNYDTDLYYGVQQGDNGQSMVLGGFDKDGNSMYNELKTKNIIDDIYAIGEKILKKPELLFRLLFFVIF